MASRKKTDEAKREFRRKWIAANLLAGLNYRQMAEALNISVGTISNDVKIILGRWQREQVEEVDDWVRLQNARLNALTNGLWESGLKGETQAVDRLLKIMERRAKLLGLDGNSSPSIQINNNNTMSFSVDDLVGAAKFVEEWRKGQSEEFNGPEGGDSEMPDSA